MKSSRLLYAVIVVSGILAMVLVSASIVWLDHHRTIEETNRARVAAAREAWSRYDSSVAACQRGNKLRRTVNDLVGATDALNELLIQFFDSSVRLRRQLGQPALAKDAVEARERIREIATRTHEAKIVDCLTTIPTPISSRPQPPKT